MSLLKRVSGAYVWSQIGRLLEVCLFFGFSVLLARILGPERYGTYATAVSAAGLMVFVTLLGIGPETLGKFVPELSAEGGAIRVRALLMKFLALRGCAVIGLALVAFVASWFFFRSWSLRFFGGALVFVLFLSVARSAYDLAVGFFGALLELRRVAVAKLLAGVAAPLIFLLSIATAGPHVGWALLATAVAYFIGGGILVAPWLRGRSSRPEAPEARRVPMRRILQFGLFTWAVNFFVFVLSDNTDVLLVRWLSGDPSATGYYAVGGKLVFRLVTLTMAWVPLMAVASLSHANLEGGPERMASGVEAQWKLAVISLVPPLAFLYSFARPIIETLFSSRYLPSLSVVQVLCIFMVCSALAGFYLHSGILYVLNHERLAAIVVGSVAVFNIGLEVYLVPRTGMIGAAWATGASYLLLAFTTALVSARFAPLRVPWVFNLKVTGACIISVTVTYWLDHHFPVGFGTTAVAWVVVFAASLAMLRPLDRSDSERLCRLNPLLGGIVGRLFSRRYLVGEARG